MWAVVERLKDGRFEIRIYNRGQMAERFLVDDIYLFFFSLKCEKQDSQGEQVWEQEEERL